MIGDISVPLVRRFLPIPKEVDTSQEQFNGSGSFYSAAETWETLTAQYRVVILADAGAGKTHEMRNQTIALRNSGQRAFFLRIEDMLNGPIDAFEIGTEIEYRAWQQSADEAWFFLDSIDEAKLDSPRTFEKAVRRFATELHDSKQRAHVILSSRPYAWAPKSDLALVEELLPFAKPCDTKAIGIDEEVGLDALHRRETTKDPSESWKVYQLGPLNAGDIRIFAANHKIKDIDALLAAIARSDLWSMAERPFDLLDIFGQWRPGEPLGSRLDILQHGIYRRLLEIDETRIERQPLNIERALEGARRLAVAVTLTKQAGIRIPDGLHNDIGVDAATVLGDWQLSDVKTLLSRAIFNDAIFAAVRFRHREIRELLTAEWFAERIKSGDRRAVEALIFRDQYGEQVITPTMRPILTWLILFDPEIRSRASLIAPEIASEGGDIARLPVEERRALLASIVERISRATGERIVQHNDAIVRIAQRDLGDDALSLIEKYQDNDEALFFLGRFVWQGELQGCTAALLPIAMDSARGIYARIVSTRAVLAVGTTEQRIELWSGILAAPSLLDQRLLTELLDANDIDSDIIPKLLLAIDKLDPGGSYERTGLRSTMHRLIERLGETQLWAFVVGLNQLLDREPHVERGEYSASVTSLWLLGPALHAAEQLIILRSASALDEHVIDLLMKARVVRYRYEEDLGYKPKLAELVPAWYELNDRLYWADIRRTRLSKASKGERVIDDWVVAWGDPFWRFDETSFDRMIGYATAQPLLDDRLVALTRAFLIYRDAARPRHWRNQLNIAAKGHNEMRERLALLYRPRVSEIQRRWKRQIQTHERRSREQRRKHNETRRAFIMRLKANPDIVRNPPGLRPGQLSYDQFHLMCILEEDGLHLKRAQGAQWNALIGEFGRPVAEAYRDAALAHWREYMPGIRSEGANADSVPYSLIFAMVGLEIERTENPNFPAMLSAEAVNHVLRYIGWELNGLPRWMESLFASHRELVLGAVWKEIEWELEHSRADNLVQYMLHDVRHYAPWLHAAVAPQLLSWLAVHEPPNIDTLRHSLHILVSGGISEEALVGLARMRVSTAPDDHLPRWYALWVDGEPQTGIPSIETWLASIVNPETASRAAQLFVVSLQGGHWDDRPKLGAFRSPLYLKMLHVLMHRYVPSEDDINRVGTGAYSPELRDEAQQARDLLLNQLSEIPGKAAYVSLLELARDHPDKNYRSWMLIRARMRATSDSDLEPWTTKQCYEFAREAERSPVTSTQLFDLARARLLDFKDWVEQGNDSPAATYRRVETETEMRNLVAGWLNQQARGRYTTAQEPEYANAQRSDFWIQSPAVAVPVPVELKLVDKEWSGPDLCERLRNQLVGDYLRERRATAGVMLLVWQGKEPTRRWEIGGERLSFSALADGLSRYWLSISTTYPEIETIEVIGIDLSLREKKSAT